MPFPLRLSAVLAALILFGVSASAKAPRYALVPPRVCLAGNWGTATNEWRVQLAVTSDENNAIAYERRLAKRGFRAEHYIAIWRAQGDAEPLAVVSKAVFKDHRDASRAAKKLRKAGFAAFPRKYARYHW